MEERGGEVTLSDKPRSNELTGLVADTALTVAAEVA